MNIVIPMAGRGSRLAEFNTKLPKPFIQVAGRPIYEWSIRSLPLEQAKQIILIVLKEHLELYDLEADLEKRFPELKEKFKVISIDEVTTGQLTTVLKAQEYIDSPRAVMIYNADTYSEVNWDTLNLQNIDGFLGVFEAPGEQWSFVSVDSQGFVTEVREKQRISQWASTGLYYFSSGQNFLRHAKQVFENKDTQKGEYYVSSIYRPYLSSGARFNVVKFQKVYSLGTPEELCQFETHING